MRPIPNHRQTEGRDDSDRLTRAPRHLRDSRKAEHLEDDEDWIAVQEF